MLSVKHERKKCSAMGKKVAHGRARNSCRTGKFFIFRLEMHISKLRMCIFKLRICILRLRMKLLPACSGFLMPVSWVSSPARPTFLHGRFTEV